MRPRSDTQQALADDRAMPRVGSSIYDDELTECTGASVSSVEEGRGGREHGSMQRRFHPSPSRETELRAKNRRTGERRDCAKRVITGTHTAPWRRRVGAIRPRDRATREANKEWDNTAMATPAALSRVTRGTKARDDASAGFLLRREKRIRCCVGGRSTDGHLKVAGSKPRVSDKGHIARFSVCTHVALQCFQCRSDGKTSKTGYVGGALGVKRR